MAAQISVRALQSAIEIARGRPQDARVALSTAVGLASGQGIVRPFLDNYHRLREPLTELARSQVPESPFLEGLLAESEERPVARPRPARLAQPLTPREHDVLRYLRSRLSIGEIAATLNLSPNTVNTHVKHIYEKLQATGRQDAVRRARDLNLT
jgi:LuxR family transcriptional regulator, maltose regulon positive regulatory protein